MTAKTFFTVLIFLLFLVLFSTTFFVSTEKFTSLTNQTNQNLTIISRGSDLAELRLCDYNGTLEFFGVVGGADCIIDFISFTFGFAGVKSDIQWLGYIIFALTITLVYLGIRLLKGGG